MRPLILSIFALFLAGCTHSQQSMVDTFRASLFDNQDITVADQQIQALPYSTMYLRLNEGGNDSNLLIVFYVQIMPDDFVMQLHRF